MLVNLYARLRATLEAYTVRLAGHVEWPSLELGKVLEENDDKSCDVCGSVFRVVLCGLVINFFRRLKVRLRTYHILPVLGIRESRVDRLVNEKYVGALVPRVRVPCEVPVRVYRARAYNAVVQHVQLLSAS